MGNKKETDIGPNTLVGRMISTGVISNTAMCYADAPIWLIAVPVTVVIVGCVIAIWSQWASR